MNRPGLRLMRSEDEHGDDTAVLPRAAPEDAQEQPAAVADDTQGGQHGRFISIFRSGAGRSRQAARRQGGWVNWVLSSRPPSIRDQHDYLRNRGWLTPGHEGGVADRAGEAYHYAIGLPGVAAGNWVSGTCSRPLRLAGHVAGFLILAFGVLRLTGTPAGNAEVITAVLALVPVLWVAIVWAALTARRAAAGKIAARQAPGSAAS